MSQQVRREIPEEQSGLCLAGHVRRFGAQRLNSITFASLDRPKLRCNGVRVVAKVI